MGNLKKIFFVFALLLTPFFVNAEELTEVSTLESFIGAVNENSSIKLLDDIDISEEGVIINNNVTIDLNGYKIMVINEYNNNIRVAEGAELTIKDTSTKADGKLVSKGTKQNNGRGAIDVNGTFILESGTIEALVNDKPELANFQNGIVVSKETKQISQGEGVVATAIIKGGKIEATTTAIANHNTFAGDTKIIVEGGTLISNDDTIYSVYTSSDVPGKHDVVIKGGTFISKNKSNVMILSSEYALDKKVIPELTITGGNFETSNNKLNIDFAIFAVGGDVILDNPADIKTYFNLDLEAAKFNNNPTNLSSFVKSGYEFIEKDSVFSIEMKKPVMDEVIIPEKIEKPIIIVKDIEKTTDILLNSIKNNKDLLKLFLLEPTAKTEVVVTNIDKDKVDSDIKKDMESILTNGVITNFLNIDTLIKFTAGDKKVTNLAEAIELTVAIPTDIKNTNKDVTRKYYVLRNHNGTVEKLDATLNADGTITFKTDRFSTYAIAYEDTTTAVKPAIKNPQTGDNVIIYFIIGLLSLGGIGYVLVTKKA